MEGKSLEWCDLKYEAIHKKFTNLCLHKDCVFGCFFVLWRGKKGILKGLYMRPASLY